MNIYNELRINTDKSIAIVDSRDGGKSEGIMIRIREIIKNAHRIKQTRLEAQTNPVARAIIERGERCCPSRGAMKVMLKAEPETDAGRLLAKKATASNKDAAKTPEEQDKIYKEEAAKLLRKSSSECYGFALIAYALIRNAFPSMRVQLVNEDVHNFLIIGY
jgi:hypothetical protein